MNSQDMDGFTSSYSSSRPISSSTPVTSNARQSDVTLLPSSSPPPKDYQQLYQVALENIQDMSGMMVTLQRDLYRSREENEKLRKDNQRLMTLLNERIPPPPVQQQQQQIPPAKIEIERPLVVAPPVNVPEIPFQLPEIDDEPDDGFIPLPTVTSSSAKPNPPIVTAPTYLENPRVPPPLTDPTGNLGVTEGFELGRDLNNDTLPPSDAESTCNDATLVATPESENATLQGELIPWTKVIRQYHPGILGTLSSSHRELFESYVRKYLEEKLTPDVAATCMVKLKKRGNSFRKKGDNLSDLVVDEYQYQTAIPANLCEDFIKWTDHQVDNGLWTVNKKKKSKEQNSAQPQDEAASGNEGVEVNQGKEKQKEKASNEASESTSSTVRKRGRTSTKNGLSKDNQISASSSSTTIHEDGLPSRRTRSKSGSGISTPTRSVADEETNGRNPVRTNIPGISSLFRTNASFPSLDVFSNSYVESAQTPSSPQIDANSGFYEPQSASSVSATPVIKKSVSSKKASKISSPDQTPHKPKILYRDDIESLPSEDEDEGDDPKDDDFGASKKKKGARRSSTPIATSNKKSKKKASEPPVKTAQKANTKPTEKRKVAVMQMSDDEMPSPLQNDSGYFQSSNSAEFNNQYSNSYTPTMNRSFGFGNLPPIYSTDNNNISAIDLPKQCSQCGVETTLFRKNPMGQNLLCNQCFNNVPMPSMPMVMQPANNNSSYGHSYLPNGQILMNLGKKLPAPTYSTVLKELLPELNKFPQDAKTDIRNAVRNWLLRENPQTFDEFVIKPNGNFVTYIIPESIREKFLKWATEQQFDLLPINYIGDPTSCLPPAYYTDRGSRVPHHIENLGTTTTTEQNQQPVGLPMMPYNSGYRPYLMPPQQPDLPQQYFGNNLMSGSPVPPMRAGFPHVGMTFGDGSGMGDGAFQNQQTQSGVFNENHDMNMFQ